MTDENNQERSVPRRRFTGRHSFDARLSVMGPKGKEFTKMNGRSMDISDRGLAAVVPVELAVGDIVDLQFELPLVEKPILVQATVRHRSGSRYGFQFLTLSAEQRRHIERLCERLNVMDEAPRDL